mmetsp:Transcript_15746/g.13162  ORF Transcript_15746/g.13162 Transcript_15746/m.13162 type:complete len:188 (-) Transcript_15746:51-614(-)
MVKEVMRNLDAGKVEGHEGDGHRYLYIRLPVEAPIQPEHVQRLQVAELKITEDMLLSLLESSPNITFLDFMHTGVTTSMSVLLHGLWSKRVRLSDTPRDRTSFLCPIHGAEEIANEVTDGYERLKVAYRDIRAMRRQPTHSVEIIDSFGNLIASSCKGTMRTIVLPTSSRGHLAPKIGSLSTSIPQY